MYHILAARLWLKVYRVLKYIFYSMISLYIYSHTLCTTILLLAYAESVYNIRISSLL